MINFYKCCSENNIDVNKFYFCNSYVIVYSTSGNRYLVKKEFNNSKLYKYFESIDFNDYEKMIDCSYGCELYHYYGDSFIDKYGIAKSEILSLIDLHNKSFSYIDFDDNMKNKFYEFYKNKIDGCLKYYLKLQDEIEEMEFISPAYYLLLNNISKFYKLLHFASDKLNYINGLDSIRIREVLLVGNISIENYCYGEKKYFISFDEAKRDYLIFDLVSFYKNNIFKVDCISLIDLYNSKIKLNECEYAFFLLLICIPNILGFENSNFNNTVVVRNEVNYIDKTLKYLLEKDKENQKTN